jgi:hypothetical protein
VTLFWGALDVGAIFEDFRHESLRVVMDVWIVMRGFGWNCALGCFCHDDNGSSVLVPVAIPGDGLGNLCCNWLGEDSLCAWSCNRWNCISGGCVQGASDEDCRCLCHRC